MLDVNGDNSPENRIVTKRAVPVIAGLLAHPQAWERVRDTLGPRLAVEPKQPLRGDAWTRTAWTVLAEVFAADSTPDPFVLREQMQRLAEHKRRGLLDGWTDEYRDRVTALLPEMMLCTSASTVVSAAERLADYCDAVDVGRAMQDDAGLLLAGGLLSPAEAATRVQERAKQCRPRGVSWNNAGQRAREVFASKAPQFVPTNCAAIDEHVGGVPTKQLVGIFGRPGVGKSTVLQMLVTSMVFPNLTVPKLSIRQRAEVNTSDGRPYILVVSAENPFDMFFDRVACCVLDIASQDMLRSRAKAWHDNDARAATTDGITCEEYFTRLDQYGRMTVVDADDIGSTRAAILNYLNAWADFVDEQDPNAAKVIAFDYLQHVSQTKEPGDIAEIAKGFSDFARARGVAFLLGNQCNSDAENTLPTKESSRYSKAINDLAGQIWCLHAWSSVQRDALAKLGYKRDVLDCMVLRSDKGRGTKTGWSALLSMEGQHYRITQTSKDAQNHLADKRILRAIKDGTPAETFDESAFDPTQNDGGFPL